jgi:hypothetical protein
MFPGHLVFIGLEARSINMVWGYETRSHNAKYDDRILATLTSMFLGAGHQGVTPVFSGKFESRSINMGVEIRNSIT